MVFKFLKNQLKKGEGSQGEKGHGSQSIEYEGFTITPTPTKSAGGWTTEGDIAQQVDGETRTEHFIRAETHTDREQAITHTITKAKRIIDERSGGL